MDAAVRGTMDGMQLVLAVIAVIIVVFALVNLVDQALALLPLIDGRRLPCAPVRLAVRAADVVIGVPWARHRRPAR
jgi:concentrative nucleoside transporter, CNT family